MQRTRQKTLMETGRVVFVAVEQIRPNPSQPRKIFDPEGISELASSIAEYGILQPLSLRRRGPGFELVAGERRLRAAKLAGLSHVPAILLTVDEEQSGMLALVENLQRRDLDYFEEAEGLARLMRLYGLSQEQAALRVGKSQSAVANKLRILRHPVAVQEALRTHNLTERHARTLLRLEGEEQRLLAIEQIVERGYNVAQTEGLVERMLLEPPKPKARLGRFVLRDVRIFLNTLEKNLSLMQHAGVGAQKSQEETEEEIVLTIRIPKGKR